jgi:hypothetical protein
MSPPARGPAPAGIDGKTNAARRLRDHRIAGAA